MSVVLDDEESLLEFSNFPDDQVSLYLQVSFL